MINTQRVRWRQANVKVHKMSSAGEGVWQAWKNNVLERKTKRSTTHPASIFAAVTPAADFIRYFARRVEGAIAHQFWEDSGCGHFCSGQQTGN